MGIISPGVLAPRGIHVHCGLQVLPVYLQEDYRTQPTVSKTYLMLIMTYHAISSKTTSCAFALIYVTAFSGACYAPADIPACLSDSFWGFSLRLAIVDTTVAGAFAALSTRTG